MLKSCLLLYPVDSKQLESEKTNFEFFGKVPTALTANSEKNFENPDRGVNSFRFLYNRSKFGLDRVSGCRDMNFDE